MPEKYDFEQVRNFVRTSRLFGCAAQMMADFIVRVSQLQSPELYLAMALTVQKASEQHICLQLPEYAGQILTAENESATQLQLPELKEWLAALRQCQQENILCFMDEFAPQQAQSALLIIDRNNGCYLQRQWSFEYSIIKNLLARAGEFLDLPELKAGFLHSLTSFFKPKAEHEALDCQQLAVMAAMRRKLTVISGGPGTGKTTVAAAVLAVKLAQNPNLRIKLAAPTAKAAVRLLQSLKNNIDKLSSSAEIKAKLNSLESSTIHTLLGVRWNSNGFIYNSTNYLNCDLLLLDECSMVSQELMANTLEALSPTAELILLGDRYQLASVEAGAVMADICDAAAPNYLDEKAAELFLDQTGWSVPAAGSCMLKNTPLAGALIELKENHRFAKSAQILGEVASIIRELDDSKDIPAAAKLIAGKSGTEFEFADLDENALKKLLKAKFSEPRLPDGESFKELPRLAATGSEEDRQKAFALMDKLKILAPAYDGVRGIDNLNKIAMDILQLNNIYEPGAILLIKRNDYRINLVNGDIGLVGKDAQGNIKVFFADKLHPYDISDLPEHDAVFAMSVHKSQGSGFGETIFVMPEKMTELMTREMVYTAMTRAENKLCCIGSEEIFAQALANATTRMSNLAKRLQTFLE